MDDRKRQDEIVENVISSKIFLIKTREPNQRYDNIQDKNNKYNEVLQYFKKQTAPDRLKGHRFKTLWKAKTKNNFNYDKNLDRILQKKLVAYKYLSDLFPKPQFVDEVYTYECWYYILLPDEKQEILNTAQSDLLHNGRDRILINVRRIGFNWYCLTDDCIKYISNCFLCPIKSLQKVPSITTSNNTLGLAIK